MFFKLWISDIHVMLPSPIQKKAYLFKGRTVEHVIVFGAVTKVKELGTKLLYEVDDGTGNINCIFNQSLMLDHKTNKFMEEFNLSRINVCNYNEIDNKNNMKCEEDELSSAITTSINWLSKEVYEYERKRKTVFQLGDTICAKGRVNEFFGQREIQIYQLHLIDNLKDETGHVLDFVNLYKNEYANM
ncbi:CST complex subunit STN1-like [Lycorma delicatula]|uniref:CST complex subunit STN1-like n=1 Tax=Lycorma delicatula TaxID=130591 RepID=UPI003F50DA11